MDTELRETLRFVQQENVRLHQENRDLRQEVAKLRSVTGALRTLQEISASIDAHTNTLSLLDRILEAALASIGASDGSLTLMDEETGELAFVVVHGQVRESLVGHRIPPGAGIAGWVAAHAEPVIIPNVYLDPRFSPEVDEHFQFHTRSMLSVPIVWGEQVLGVIQAINKTDGEEFNKADLALLGVVAQLAALAMTKAIAVVPENKPV